MYKHAIVLVGWTYTSTSFKDIYNKMEWRKCMKNQIGSISETQNGSVSEHTWSFLTLSGQKVSALMSTEVISVWGHTSWKSAMSTRLVQSRRVSWSKTCNSTCETNFFRVCGKLWSGISRKLCEGEPTCPWERQTGRPHPSPPPTTPAALACGGRQLTLLAISVYKQRVIVFPLCFPFNKDVRNMKVKEQKLFEYLKLYIWPHFFIVYRS